MKIDKPLREYLDEIKKIEGYPHGRDEDILELSDPPYYTACPNPYINKFIEEYGTPYDEETDNYHREPFVGDVSEGKNDPIYNAHTYHTKVPYKAIMKYIEHYTDEGDIVFDGFCGTGMTGVGAQKLGRKAILSDLSPAATFIAYNYNTPVNVEEFESEAKRILEEVEEECGWMYETDHYKDEKYDDGGKHLGSGKINYTVWSDVFLCPYCGGEIVFWDAAVDKENGKVLKNFECPSCSAEITKNECERSCIKFYDHVIGKEVTQAKQIPVMINYSYDGRRYEKTPDENDFTLIDKINSMDIPYWFPTNEMMNKGSKWGDTWRKGVHYGITHVHHFYTKRNLWILACLKDKCQPPLAKLLFNSQLINISKLNRSRPSVSFPYNPLSGTLYISSQISESNVLIAYYNKIKRIVNAARNIPDSYNIISTNSLIENNINNLTVDYIFTDPPFGDNLMYSELNFLWEAWLKVFTNNESEAIVNKSQGKSLVEYSELMLKSFQEYYRVLKPKRWITVVFHNSKSSVWNAIQEAMIKAGFVIANVSILDKQQGSFKQVTSTGAVKNDLVISAYKPPKGFEKQFLENAGEGMEEDFIRMQLNNLTPTPNIERTEKMLYSKMLSYYLRHGYIVRYDSRDFYSMLKETFYEEDGYWFANRDQLEKYMEYKKKMKLDGIVDSAYAAEKLLVYDEKTAIIWLNNFLEEPKDYSTIYTYFTKVANISDDDIPELKDILENNFIPENDKYRRPSTEGEELRVRQKREKELMRDFNSLFFDAQSSRKKIKSCRNEALVFGFQTLYQKGNFDDILTVAKKLDKRILERNSEIRDFIEIAEIKTGNI
ncbi:DNA methyltransferase [Flexistipes sp.]|uniref:DNA methyltransferase n=1 Tax=Flexistipes sp. TaxID=3088135 RepID=UPI002E228D98|nr:DNA methyltransferase [Flexistipes sp.]